MTKGRETVETLYHMSELNAFISFDSITGGRPSAAADLQGTLQLRTLIRIDIEYYELTKSKF